VASSKEQLLDAIHEREVRRIASDLDESLRDLDPRGLPPLDALISGVCDRLTDSFETNADILRAFIAHGYNNDTIYRRGEAATQDLARTIDELFEPRYGEIPTDDPARRVADAFFAVTAILTRHAIAATFHISRPMTWAEARALVTDIALGYLLDGPAATRPSEPRPNTAQR
jgi:AcrR family transcriptional regulator